MQNFTKYISRYNNDDTISIIKIEILELSRSYQENQWLNVLRTLDNGSSTREWIYTKRHRSNINQYKWNSKATALFTLISCFFGCVVLIVMNRRTCCRIGMTLTVLYHIYEIEPFLSVCSSPDGHTGLYFLDHQKELQSRPFVTQPIYYLLVYKTRT